MKITPLLSSTFIIGTIFTLSLSLGCGGSSGGNEASIDGALGRSLSTPLSKEFSGENAEPVEGAEVCCSTSCSFSDTNGSFQLNVIPQEGEISCTVNGAGFSNDSFTLTGVTTVGNYSLTITASEGSDGKLTFTTDLELNNQDPLTPPPMCGNGITELGGGEDCDGSDLSGENCFSIGFSKGTLRCNDDCSFNTSQCIKNESPVCGDEIIEGGEECDGTNLGGESCESRGFAGGGILSCAPDCTLNSTKCIREPMGPVCGNDVAELGGEECDGPDLAGESCESLNLGSGELACLENCEFNISKCRGAPVPTCDEPEQICQNTGAIPECLSCSCNDGFEIGSCSAICFDTMATPTICSGGRACTDGSTPVCPT